LQAAQIQLFKPLLGFALDTLFGFWGQNPLPICAIIWHFEGQEKRVCYIYCNLIEQSDSFRFVIEKDSKLNVFAIKM